VCRHHNGGAGWDRLGLGPRSLAEGSPGQSQRNYEKDLPKKDLLKKDPHTHSQKRMAGSIAGRR
jgi:hypothetical protein